MAKKKIYLVVAVLVFSTVACSLLSPAVQPTQDPLLESLATQVANMGVEQAAQATLAAESPAATQAVQPTYTPYPTYTPNPDMGTQVQSEPTQAAPVLDLEEIFTGSVPNFCDVTNTMQEDIDGEMLQHEASIYENSAIGADQCAAAFEGRWYEGFPPTEDHHITAFIGAAENVSVYQGSQWLLPVGTAPRDIVYGLAIGKCDNWDAAQVDPEPVIFDYVEVTTKRIVHTDPTTCDILRSAGNPLPEEVGLIPGELLPHFSLGYTWGKEMGEGDALSTSAEEVATFSGESKFDSENKGMVCRTDTNPLLGNNAVTLDPAWDPQCIYLVDGVLNGERSVGLVKGFDILAASATFDASVWAVPAEWIALEWADKFALDNCPAALPVFVWNELLWEPNHIFTCP